ncbi:MAG: hypothetical protein WC438_05850 [Candidatus Pacearchaeota archaeon]|jgi:cbb3-type cytochrome oxidase subunit 3
MNWNIIESFIYDILTIAVLFTFIIIVIVFISYCKKKIKGNKE